MSEKKSYDTQVLGNVSNGAESADFVETLILEESSPQAASEASETAVLPMQPAADQKVAIEHVESNHDTVNVGHSWLLKNAHSNAPKPDEFKQASPRGRGSARVTIPFPVYGTVDESYAGIVSAPKLTIPAGDSVHQKSMERLTEDQRKSYDKVPEVLGRSERGKDSIDPTRPDLWPGAKQKLFPQIVEGVIRAGMEYKLDEDNMPEADLAQYRKTIESVRANVGDEKSQDS